jgi:hypothetical protein
MEAVMEIREKKAQLVGTKLAGRRSAVLRTMPAMGLIYDIRGMVSKIKGFQRRTA